MAAVHQLSKQRQDMGRHGNVKADAARMVPDRIEILDDGVKLTQRRIERFCCISRRQNLKRLRICEPPGKRFRQQCCINAASLGERHRFGYQDEGPSRNNLIAQFGYLPGP